MSVSGILGSELGSFGIRDMITFFHTEEMKLPLKQITCIVCNIDEYVIFQYFIWKFVDSIFWLSA